MKKWTSWARPIGLVLVLAGCPSRDLGPVRPVVQVGTIDTIRQRVTSTVDLLVMVDNSNSMAQEQANLTENFRILIDTLTNPADPDHAVTDLHVGVISSDMGTGGYAVQTCDQPVAGDDGVLLHVASGGVSGCAPSYPEFLSYESDQGDTPAQMDADFSCLATLGTGGCGFEQQLKAVRKALTVHRDGANLGFLRDDSLLAILLVTDEEDCSVREDVPNATDIFNTQLALGPLNLRCYSHREQYVEPVDSYVRDILALRADDPDKLVVAAIVGIPPAGRHHCNLERMTDGDFQCLLDLPEMQEVVDNSADGRGERLTPSCDEPGLGEAFPPRRIVEFVRQINQVGNNGIVRSICDSDFRPAMEAITELIQSKVGGKCLDRPLELGDDGRVQCIVQEKLVGAEPCGPGRVDMGLQEGQRICQICQEGDGGPGHTVDELGTRLTTCAGADGPGDSYWRYLPEADECSYGRVEFVGDAVPADGSEVHLECLSRVGE